MWRFWCGGCRKTFTRLPSFLLPFKHYVAREIEAVLRHRCQGGKLSRAPSAAEESTLRRWWKEYSGKMNQWAGLLESSIWGLFGRAVGFVRLPTDPLKRLEAALSWLPPLPSRWAVLIKALYWLLPSHPLCLNWPGVCGVSWCQILEKGVDTS